MNECIGCDLARNVADVQLAHEGKYWKVILSRDQQYLGKSFVTLKRHAESLSEIEPNEAAEFYEIVKTFEKTVNEAWSPTHFNWSCLMNNAADPESEDRFHVHWHAIPRYDSTRTIQDIEFIDQRWPASARMMNELLVTDDTLILLRDTIRFGFKLTTNTD